MKILINRDVVEGPWGGGNKFVKAFYEFGRENGHKVVNKFEKGIDLVFLQDPRPNELGIGINEAYAYCTMSQNTKLIQRINECDARKNTRHMDKMLNACSKILDHTVFVSNWMKDYHKNLGWQCKSNSIIYNGADLDIFKPRDKIGNGKINIVTHHWSNNFMKGFDFYNELDDFVGDNDDFTFTYIGRDIGSFKNTKVVKPLFGEALGEELGKYDVYISASRYDPGPNHILESLACKIPTYVYSEGGGCIEFAGQEMVYGNFEQMKEILLSKNYTNNEMYPTDWGTCLEQYYDLFKEMVSDKS